MRRKERVTVNSGWNIGGKVSAHVKVGAEDGKPKAEFGTAVEFGFGLHGGFGMEGNAKAGEVDHAEIIRPIANRHRRGQVDALSFGIGL